MTSMLRRHDLIRVDRRTWRRVLDSYPHLPDMPLVAEWAEREWPVIARRRMPSDPRDGLPVALALPPSYGKCRLAFCLPSGAPIATSPPAPLRDLTRTLPLSWRPVLAALLGVAEGCGLVPRVFGSALWQHVTGLGYLTATSDLDLLWSTPDEPTALSVVRGLLRIDVDRVVRLDGELELADGAGLNWREFAATSWDSDARVLVKSLEGVELRNRTALFPPARPEGARA